MVAHDRSPRGQREEVGVSFSDEDLKGLKEDLETDVESTGILTTRSYMKRVLARLEAAEEVCRQVMCAQEKGSWIFEGCIEAWRKAAGK